MKKMIVIRTQKEDSVQDSPRNGMEIAANALMNASGYAEYVTKHGYHFTPELAECVCKQMVNTNGQIHRWSSKEVLSALGNALPPKTTLGDMTYLANMAYADFYPKVLQSETLCIEYAKAVAGDIDGYEGMPFCRWTADAIGNAVEIDWDRFV